MSIFFDWKLYFGNLAKGKKICKYRCIYTRTFITALFIEHKMLIRYWLNKLITTEENRSYEHTCIHIWSWNSLITVLLEETFYFTISELLDFQNMYVSLYQEKNYLTFLF